MLKESFAMDTESTGPQMSVRAAWNAADFLKPKSLTMFVEIPFIQTVRFADFVLPGISIVMFRRSLQMFQ